MSFCPPLLQPGDLIGICAPARFVTPDELEPAIRMLENRGYRWRLSPHCTQPYHQWGGNDTQRAKDLNDFLSDPEVKAIWFARGGYGSMRILNAIHWEQLRLTPKWLIGFSDLTAILSAALTEADLAGLHAPMPYSLKEAHQQAQDSFEAMMQTLEHGRLSLIPEGPVHRNNSFSGRLVGGNLSLLYALNGTPFFPITDGDVLFIEDLDEYYYHLDRMILSLQQSSVFNRISALLVGGITDMKDHSTPFGYKAEEIILHHTQKSNIPVLFGIPSGHLPMNKALITGLECRWDKFTLTQGS
jgi:muramoyltetrapeptide carboxypeptidase